MSDDNLHNVGILMPHYVRFLDVQGIQDACIAQTSRKLTQRGMTGVRQWLRPLLPFTLTGPFSCLTHRA